MSNLNTAKKRASAINLGLPLDRPFAQLDNNDLEDAGERLSAAGLYALESSELPATTFAGGFTARPASLTGIYGTVNSPNRVKPTPPPVFKTTTWNNMVRFTEGPQEHARRNRFVAYRFGGGRGPSRQFWDGK